MPFLSPAIPGSSRGLAHCECADCERICTHMHRYPSPLARTAAMRSVGLRNAMRSVTLLNIDLAPCGFKPFPLHTVKNIIVYGNHKIIGGFNEGPVFSHPLVVAKLWPTGAETVQCGGEQQERCTPSHC